MPIRNPFARRPVGTNVHETPQDENVATRDVSHPGFERVDTVGSKASSSLSIRSARSQDTGEYKLSVVNDSGVYLPPSPTEEKSAWPRRYLTTASRSSSDSRGNSGEIEHFSISRESFDSYRRSFDISARSPILSSDSSPARQSLDSAQRFQRMRATRTVLGDRSNRSSAREPPTPEESFEDVGLGDDKANQQQPHRKTGFFSKFGGQQQPQDAGTSQTAAMVPAGSTTSSGTGVARFLMPGRKRGQSGQGAELRQMDRPRTAGSLDSNETREAS